MAVKIWFLFFKIPACFLLPPLSILIFLFIPFGFSLSSSFFFTSFFFLGLLCSFLYRFIFVSFSYCVFLWHLSFWPYIICVIKFHHQIHDSEFINFTICLFVLIFFLQRIHVFSTFNNFPKIFLLCLFFWTFLIKKLVYFDITVQTITKAKDEI